MSLPVQSAWSQSSEELINNLRQSAQNVTAPENTASDQKGKQQQQLQQRRKKVVKNGIHTTNSTTSTPTTNQPSTTSSNNTPSSSTSNYVDSRVYTGGPVLSSLNLKEIDSLFQKLYTKAESGEKKPFKFSDKTNERKKENGIPRRRTVNFEDEVKNILNKDSTSSQGYNNTNGNHSSHGSAHGGHGNHAQGQRTTGRSSHSGQGYSAHQGNNNTQANSNNTKRKK